MQPGITLLKAGNDPRDAALFDTVLQNGQRGGAIQYGRKVDNLIEQVKRAVSVAGGTAFTVSDCHHTALTVIGQLLCGAIRQFNIGQAAAVKAGMVVAVTIVSLLLQGIGELAQA
nr:hypothetical protein [Xenorhabdus bovienii]